MTKMCKCKSITMVKEWQDAFGIATADEPTLDDEALNALCVDLLMEECGELQQALHDKNKVETLDALTDIQYVLDGIYLRLGFWKYKDEAFKEVQNSNMSKLGEHGKPILREDGKILKGPNFFRPDLAKILVKGN